MNSIRTERIALDTNVFIFALRQTEGFPACNQLLFGELPKLNIYVLLQVLLELNQNLSNHQVSVIFIALKTARSIHLDYAAVDLELVEKWKIRGAKKGDAVISAHLEMAGISYLISENRHFLSEISELPFKVISSQQAVSMLVD